MRCPRWRIERNLADQLSDPLLAHDTALIAIAAAFGTGVCAERLWDWLDDAARPLFDGPVDDLRDRVVALAQLMTNRLGLRAATGRYESLLLDHAIAERAAHPLLLAALGHELARRSGWQGQIARAPNYYCTVLMADGYFCPVAYGAEFARFDPGELTACCPHELTYITLAEIGRQGPVELTASANRIREILPVQRHRHEEDE